MTSESDREELDSIRAKWERSGYAPWKDDAFRVLRIAEDALDAARPRVVETEAELEALPEGSVVRNEEDVCEKLAGGWGEWYRVGDEMSFPVTLIQLPATVLFMGGDGE